MSTKTEPKWRVEMEKWISHLQWDESTPQEIRDLVIGNIRGCWKKAWDGGANARTEQLADWVRGCRNLTGFDIADAIERGDFE